MTKFQIIPVRYLLCATLFSLVSCNGLVTGPPVRDPAYSWGIKNRSSHELSAHTVVTYTQDNIIIEADSGASFPGVDSAHDCGRDPIPDSVHVHWIYERDGSVHDADVKVHGHIKDEKNFSGTIYIVITDSGATLEAETFQEEDDRAAASRPSS